MGVVNITPDSFSDGGRYLEVDRAVERALSLVDAGAEILDLGGESSRPGALPVSSQEEMDRVIPVLTEVRKQVPVMISVDTYKAPVAEAALSGGADIVNDISAFKFDEKMPEVVNRFQAGIILMNMRGTPSTMHKLPPSTDIFQEVYEDLQMAVNKAYKSAISHDRIILDPGIGFGKNAVESLQLLNRLSGLQALQLPILVGTSRKSFIGKVLDQPVGARLMGTVASSIVAVLKGAHILRVHDLEEVDSAARTADAIMTESLPE
jgi:dihydropteroate synthase